MAELGEGKGHVPRAPPQGGAEMMFGKKIDTKKKCYRCVVVFVVDFDQKGELNCVFYAYQIKHFLRQRGFAPWHPRHKA